MSKDSSFGALTPVTVTYVTAIAILNDFWTVPIAPIFK